MLKQCLENIGEGLLHACISSIVYICTLHETSIYTRIIINTREPPHLMVSYYSFSCRNCFGFIRVICFTFVYVVISQEDRYENLAIV